MKPGTVAVLAAGIVLFVAYPIVAFTTEGGMSLTLGVLMSLAAATSGLIAGSLQKRRLESR